MKNFLPVFLIVIISIASCRKDDAIENIPPVTVSQEPGKVTDYYPLTVGSYWIYHVYEVDTDLSEAYWRTDTVSIIRDSIINGKKYYLQRDTYFGSPGITYITDSLNYIIRNDGVKLFSHTNFTDTIRVAQYPGYCTDYYKMFDRGRLVSVPVGIFPVLERERTTYYISPHPPNNMNPRIASRQFAKGIGMVMDSNFLDFQFKWWERRLVEYHVAP